jgi:hypothetical protein
MIKMGIEEVRLKCPANKQSPVMTKQRPSKNQKASRKNNNVIVDSFYGSH